MAVRDIYEHGFDEDVPQTTSQCPECNGQVRTNARETICDDCGLVIDEQVIDRGPEWRDDDETDRKRIGRPRIPLYHDHGLTAALYGRTDSNGSTVSASKRRQFQRFRTHHWRASWGTKANRNLGHGITELRRLVRALSLSNTVRDRACTLFRTAQTNDLLRGRSIESIAAASVYAVCRCDGLPRTLGELAEYAPHDESTIRGSYRVLNVELGLPARPPRPRTYVPRFASELDVPNLVQHRASELATRAAETPQLMNCNPAGVTAACLFIVAQEAGLDITQKTLADFADISTDAQESSTEFTSFINIR